MSEQVHAELVGSIMRVDVAPGDVVTPADPLVLMESMKMEIPVHPERGGTVSRVEVRAGDVVTEGDLLIVID